MSKLGLFVGFLLSSCMQTDPQPQVAERAAIDFECPQKDLEVMKRGQCFYRVEGCGKTAGYLVRPLPRESVLCCPLSGCSVHLDSAITPLRSSEPARSEPDVSQGPPNDLDSGSDYVIALLAKKSFPEAVRVAQNILREHPNDPTALHHLALAQLLSGDVDQASKNIDMSAIYSPKDADIRALQRRIDDVRSGAEQPPRTLAELGRAGHWHGQQLGQ